MVFHSAMFTPISSRAGGALPHLQPVSGNDLTALLALLLLLFVFGVCLVALTVLLVALFPRTADRTQTALLRSPRRAFFIGLANYLFLGAISLLLLSTDAPPLGLIALIILGAVLIVTLFGLTGLARLLGERLSVLAGRELPDLRRLIWGAVCMELAALLPVVGWFLLAPALLMFSFGAAVLGWRNRPAEDAGAAA